MIICDNFCKSMQQFQKMSLIWQRIQKPTLGVSRWQGKAMIRTGWDNEQKKMQKKNRSHTKKKKVQRVRLFSQKKMQRIRLFSQNHSSGLPRSCYVQRLPWGGRSISLKETNPKCVNGVWKCHQNHHHRHPCVILTCVSFCRWGN